MARTLELVVNGNRHSLDAEPARTLLNVLRDELGLTGTKYGCGEGQCGACTVLVDGIATRSCQSGIGALGGKKITTIEGLEKNGKLHPVQQAFLDADAMQCGYCTPGMILACAALLEKNPQPTEAEILQDLQGNVCRCGTYPRIRAALGFALIHMMGLVDKHDRNALHKD